MKSEAIAGNTEIPFPADATLVVRTDLKGVITDVNGDLAALVGCPPQELVGTSYRALHHPDMPPQVFDEMWETLGQNRPWQGVLKNVCRNGDHYWVDALTVPIREDHATVGYLSVYSLPSQDAVRFARERYGQLAGSSAPLRASPSLTEFLTVKSGVVIGIIFVSIMMIVGGALGITGLSRSNESMEALYRNQLQPALMMGRISFLMADNRSRVALGLQDLARAESAAREGAPGPLQEVREVIAGHAGVVEKNMREIAGLWTDFTRLPQGEEEAALAKDYWRARQAYAEEGLQKSLAALAAGDLNEARRIFRDRVNPLYDEAAVRADQLLGRVKLNAEDQLHQVVARNNAIRDVALFGIAAGLVVVIFSGTLFLLGVVRPLDQAISHLERIANGNLSGQIDIDGGGETGRLTRSIAIMQLRLKVILDEIRRVSLGINSGCSTLNDLSMAVVERYDEQQDRIYEVIDSTDQVRRDQTQECDQATKTLNLAERIMSIEALHKLEDYRQLVESVRKVAASSQLQVFVSDDMKRKLQYVAELVVDNRAAAQGAWQAAEEMRLSAGELDNMVRYFN